MKDLPFPFPSVVTEKPVLLDLILFVLFLKQLKLLKMFIQNVWAPIKIFGLIYSLVLACTGISTLGQDATALGIGYSLTEYKTKCNLMKQISEPQSCFSFSQLYQAK